MKRISYTTALGDHEGDELIMKKDVRDQTYVVRCWVEPSLNPNVENDWRFMVERVGKGSEPHGFTDLNSLITYINTELTRTEDVDDEGKHIEKKNET